MAATSVFLVRESNGTYALGGPPSFQPWSKFERDGEESRFISVSPNGQLVAIGNSSVVNIYDTRDGSLRSRIRHRMLNATFSPNGQYLVEWNNPNPNADNFQIWRIGNGKDVGVVHSIKLNKEPEVQFSTDESVFARLDNSHILFSKCSDFSVTERKLDQVKIGKFSFSTAPKTPEAGPLFVACFVQGDKKASGPSFVRIFRYPNFEVPVASKSFFQADRVEMKWNKKGQGVLLITSSDVDKTGKSYYGKTMLQYMDTKGESASVQTDSGSDTTAVHAAEWSPCSTCFAAILGKMPQTKAVLFNTKCEKIMETDVAARNAIYFNPQGNLLLLGAFGNLAQGRIEVWEVKQHKKMIAAATAPATTQLEWLSDGTHFITATTAPRMQVGNEFHVWDYKGKEVHKWKAEKHLFGVVPFRSDPIPDFPSEELDKFIKNQGKKPMLISKIEEQKKASVYVPPSKRNLVGLGGASPAHNKNTSQTNTGQSQLTEADKKIRAIKKKLEQIEKIKEMLKEGKKVEKNQEEKLKTESDLLQQLEDLKVS